MKKILKFVGILLALILVALGVAGFLFRNEIASLASLTARDDHFYTMDFHGDYGLKELMETGVGSDQELTGFVVKKLMKGLPVTIDTPDLGCSTFHAKTPEGDMIFGRNFDNMDADYALVHTKPSDGYESLSMVNLSYVSYVPGKLSGEVMALAAPYIPMDGINEKGLSIGVLQLYTEETAQDQGKKDITTSLAIRLVLDTCATVEEAIEAFSSYDMHSSAGGAYHFQLADASGDSATIEYIEQEMRVFRNENASTCTTNFILSDPAYETPDSGQDRFAILRTTLDEKESEGNISILTEEEGMALLESVKQVDHDVHGDIMNTLWSALYNNTDRTLTLAVGMNYDQLFHFDIHGGMTY